MFVQFTDKDGRETWVNPIHVKLVRTHHGLIGGKKGTELWFSFDNLSEAVYVPQSPAEVASLLDAAMPTVIVMPPDEGDSGQRVSPMPSGA